MPVLNDVRGISLAEAALLSAMPSFGMVITLIGWGYVLDLVGERIVLTLGLAVTATAAFFAASVNESMLARCRQCPIGQVGAQLVAGRCRWLMVA
ncbi:hypothetical protein A9W99_11590 [Mycobacterium sp. 1164966.3]|uniref:MFS transporter n=1 Tax=Mycobacterium sp. 1164966.3 TaxID=1856861 RepID=UPI0007FE41B5|nr:hypothetical protein A9W99_11590 [Mycobacterium sp. 1164966.3]